MLIDILLVLYKKTLSTILKKLGFECRFYPTCSEYMCQAIKENGLGRGFIKGVDRLKRCNSHNFSSCIDYP